MGLAALHLPRPMADATLGLAACLFRDSLWEGNLLAVLRSGVGSTLVLALRFVGRLTGAVQSSYSGEHVPVQEEVGDAMLDTLSFFILLRWQAEGKLGGRGASIANWYSTVQYIHAMHSTREPLQGHSSVGSARC